MAALVVFAIATTWGAPADAAPTEYFVDFDAAPGIACDDAGPGTDPRSGGLPWCTLPGTRGTSYFSGFLPGPWARIHAGDTISVKAGTTHTTADDGGAVLINPDFYDDGTAAARIVIRKHPAWGTNNYASINGTGMFAQGTGLVTVYATDYLTIDGLEIFESADSALQIELDAHHVTVEHCYIHDGHTTGGLVLLSGCTTSPCNQIVRNNIVANCEHGGGIFVYDNPGGHVLVEHNVVRNICGGTGNFDGIQCGAADGSTNYCAIVDNLVYAHGPHSGYPSCPSSGSDPIDAGGGGCHHHDLVDGNEVYDAGGTFLTHSSYEDTCSEPLDSYNIVRRNRLTNIGLVTYSYPNDTIFYNNTLFNPDLPTPVQIYANDPEEPPGESYGTEAHGPRRLAIGHDIDFARLTFKNNIMWGHRSYHVLLNGVTGSRNDVRWSSLRLYYNLYSAFVPVYWYANETDEDATRYGTLDAFLNSRVTDPPDVGSIFSNAAVSTIFIDAASRDYRLPPGSPAIDAGTAITHAVGASAGGANGSVNLTVERASFVDGYDGLLAPDHLTVGDCDDVAIVGIDDFAATILLAAPCRWNDGDPVNLASQGRAPDLGALEVASPVTSTPTATTTPAATATETPVPTATATPLPQCAPGTCAPCEACDPAVGCVAAPRTGCHQPTARSDGRLQIVDKKSTTLKWQWTKGSATTVADFGDPRTGDDYTFCVFDESGATPHVAFRAATRTGTCGRSACWKKPNASSFAYKDRAQIPDGLDAVLLKSGAAGKAKVVVAGKGANLDLPTLPLALPLRVQLVAENGQCWENRIVAGGADRNDAKQFKGDAEAP